MKIEVISSNWQRSKKDCQASDNFLTFITQRRFQLNRFIGDLEKRPCGFRFLLRANWHVRLTARYNRLYYKLYFSHYSRSHLKYSTSEYIGLILAYKVYVAVWGQMFVERKMSNSGLVVESTQESLVTYSRRDWKLFRWICHFDYTHSRLDLVKYVSVTMTMRRGLRMRSPSLVTGNLVQQSQDIDGKNGWTFIQHFAKHRRNGL